MSSPTCPFCGIKVIPQIDGCNFLVHPEDFDCPLEGYSLLEASWRRRPEKERRNLMKHGIAAYNSDQVGEIEIPKVLEEHLYMIRTWLKGLDTQASITNQILKAILDQNS